MSCTLIFCFTISGCSLFKEKNSTQPDYVAAAMLNAQLGVRYLKKGKIQRAKSRLLLALKYDRKLPEAQGAMAYFLEKTGEKEKAEAFYLRALRYSHESGEALNNYGTYLCRMKQYKASLKYFTRAAHNIDYVNTAKAYENAGLCAAKIPNLSLAYHYYQKAYKNGKNDKLRYEMSDVLYKLKKYAKANHILKKYIEINTKNKPALSLGIQIAKKLNDEDLQEFYQYMLDRA
jgi:type IV pilus assembly protein PilF